MELPTKNFKHWKTSIIGVLLILGAIAYIFLVEDSDKIIFFGSLGTGIAMLFMPDTLINALGSFITKNKDKEV